MKLFRSSTMARFGHRHNVSAASEVSDHLSFILAGDEWQVVVGSLLGLYLL